MIVIDGPGLGKTATITNAMSKFPGAGYMRVEATAKAGALHELKLRVEKACGEWAASNEELTRASLEAKLYPFCYQFLHWLFAQYEQEVNRLGVCILSLGSRTNICLL